MPSGFVAFFILTTKQKEKQGVFGIFLWCLWQFFALWIPKRYPEKIFALSGFARFLASEEAKKSPPSRRANSNPETGSGGDASTTQSKLLRCNNYFLAKCASASSRFPWTISLGTASIRFRGSPKSSIALLSGVTTLPSFLASAPP